MNKFEDEVRAESDMIQVRIEKLLVELSEFVASDQFDTESHYQVVVLNAQISRINGLKAYCKVLSDIEHLII